MTPEEKLLIKKQLHYLTTLLNQLLFLYHNVESAKKMLFLDKKLKNQFESYLKETEECVKIIDKL